MKRTIYFNVLRAAGALMTFAGTLLLASCSVSDDPVPPSPSDPSVSAEAVFNFFKEINAVPRPSKNEGQIRQYLMKFAEDHGLKWINADGNIIIYKDATEGMEQAPSLVLQTHMDMVCVAAEGYKIDFDKQGIEQEIVDGYIQSRGNKTSLGADDGIGMGIVLAILDSKQVRHGPLECLFTWNEEDGMGGATALKPGVLKSKLMINLDSEEDGKLLVGTAGAVTINIDKTFSPEAAPAGYTAYTLDISHLEGGHSGVNIPKGGASAIKLMGVFLAGESAGWRLVSINGGTAGNAIAASAQATLLLPAEGGEAFKARFEQFMGEAKAKYAQTDPAMTFSCTKTAAADKCMPAEAAQVLIGGLAKAPQGVLEWNKVDPTTFEVSNNIGIVTTSEDKWSVVALPRAFNNPGLDKVVADITAAFGMGTSGAVVTFSNRFAPWSPNLESPLIKYAQKTYQNLMGKPIVTFIVGGGVEASRFAETYPDMQVICLGPTIYDCHSIKERVVISTVENTWKYTLQLIGNIREL
ncbi:MAG: beta-Ala-His dipeptidase [Prevotella sp.]|nr:beta-Ala-His dipeptidase [Prevotella sp.]